MASRDPRRMLVVVASPELNQAAEAAFGAIHEADAEFGSAIDLVLADESSEAAAAFGAADEGPLGRSQEAALLQACQMRWPDADVRLVFMRRGLRDRWFSHWNAETRTALVSLDSWEAIAPLPVAAFVADEIVLYGLFTLSRGYTPRMLMHEETRGCLFDFCAEKQDISFKLRTGDVCPDCRATLARIRVPVERVQRMLDAVRGLALARGPMVGS